MNLSTKIDKIEFLLKKDLQNWTQEEKNEFGNHAYLREEKKQLSEEKKLLREEKKKQTLLMERNIGNSSKLISGSS